MRSISEVVRNFKLRWTEELETDAIEQACRDAKMTWIQSTLNPIVTVQVFLLRILHGNTACEHLPQLAKLSFTAAAYCKARMRLKLCTCCWNARSHNCIKTSWTVRGGWGIACSSSMVRASRCRTHAICKSTSGSREANAKVAVFRRRIGWR